MSVSLLRLHELYESLTPSERRIADYFEANLDKLVDTSILEVAEACQTSKSAVVRLCKKSGYRGYKDFLNAVSADLNRLFKCDHRVFRVFAGKASVRIVFCHSQHPFFLIDYVWLIGDLAAEQ